MIFKTNTQTSNLAIFLFAGIIIGFLSLFYFLIFVKNFNKKSIKLIIFTVFYSFFTIFFVFLINFLNFGKLSFVLLSAYTIGYIWIKQLFKKSVVILEKRWYNVLNRLSTKIKSLKNKKGKKKKYEQQKES